ncbi:MAG: exonuclease SbcCD subunit D [Nocardioides sp.]|uniref:exonuclease SbcCD subunit D n=1 Tax=Nocardioides sp. TaxID=35761 RepID=UPI0039E34F46
MRILHTSDWHLGRSFHRVGMLEHQAAYVDHLLEVVDAERVDVVLISGDVYDRALPQVDTVRLASQALARLAASRAKVILTSGNHDSASRLGFGSELIDAAGVFIRTELAAVGRPVLLEDAHGEVAFYPLPYLDPITAKDAWGLSARSHQAALAEAMRRVGSEAERRGGRSVAMAHAFVAGNAPAATSDSERDISVGGVSIVAAHLFEQMSYTALGHLHGAQQLGETIRYSGSPLAYSFSEEHQTKGSWLVDLDATGFAAAEFVPAPVPRRLARVEGDLETLLTDSRFAQAEDAWVQATLTDQVRPSHAMERLRRRFPHALVLGFAATAPVVGHLPRPGARPRRDHELVTDFVTELRGRAPSTEELALLGFAVDACCEDADLDPRATDADQPAQESAGSGAAEEFAEVLF